METAEKSKNDKQQKTNAIENARSVLICLVFIGFAISGIVEHGVTVVLSSSDPLMSILYMKNTKNEEAEIKRYCDPPNMTALSVYYGSGEENSTEDEYYVWQAQETAFKVNLTEEEKVELVLKKFFLWGTLFSPIPASRLAANIGPKKMFGYSLLGAAASTLLVPASWLTSVHVVIRFIQGLFCGALIPSGHSLAVNWFPIYRRSSFVSFYSAKFMGYALCELLTTKLVQIFGPGSIYYITSILTAVWFIPWSIMVFNTPDKHSKYFGCEKPTAILNCERPTTSKFPLKHFICSRPVWMSTGAIMGAYSAQISINVGMRWYLKYVYKISDGFISAIPCVMHVVFAISCGYIADYIQKVRLVSITSSRRILIYVSHFIPAGLLFIIGYVSCEPLAPIIIYSMAIITSGAIYSGAFCSTIDTAPNYAGTVIAFCCTFGTVGSLVMIYLISDTLNGEVSGSWRLTFSLTSLILLVSSIFFMLRGSGAIQFWNALQCNEDNVAANSKNDETLEISSTIVTPSPTKSRTKSIYTVEKKILKVLYVQQPEKFTRVRAYSSSLPSERGKEDKPNIFQYNSKKRASIT